MLKRIVVNIALVFGLLPAMGPFVVYLNDFLFGGNVKYDIDLLGGLNGFYQTYLGVFLFYYSLILLFLVFGIYNYCIIMKVRKTKAAFPLWIKFFIFLVLYSMVTFLTNSFGYYLGGTHELLQKIIVLAVLSAVMVTLHCWLIDRRYERKVMERTPTDAETK